jgi:hypothetical protein
MSLSGSTVGMANDFDAPANSCFGAPDASGADVVFAVTFASNGTLTATLAGSNGLQGILYSETTCGDDSTIVVCDMADTWGQMISVTAAAKPATTATPTRATAAARPAPSRRRRTAPTPAPAKLSPSTRPRSSTSRTRCRRRSATRPR